VRLTALVQERISHVGVFTTPPSRCLEAALHLNVMRYRVVRALIAARSLPEGGQPLRTLRIADMTEPPLSWLKLGERPGREIVLGQIARPWQRGGERMFPISVEEFRRFGRPGYAKIVLSVHAEPRDPGVSQLTIETRVWVTDAESRRRFGRYWVLVGPFSGVIRRLAMRALASQLGRPVRREIEGEIHEAQAL
jgi:hypothetical protein